MNTLEKIVPPLELCKKIPSGEFEDSALVWETYYSKYSIKPVVIDRKTSESTPHEFVENVYPAPTLEETITSLLTYGWLVKIDCRIQLDTLIEFYSEKQSKTEFGNTASETALRLWLKVKGIEGE